MKKRHLEMISLGAFLVVCDKWHPLDKRFMKGFRVYWFLDDFMDPNRFAAGFNIRFLMGR
jgi:hypothetical protein